jgi:hypothetical protein
MEKRHGQQVIEYVPLGSVSSTFIASRLPHRRKSRITSRDPHLGSGSRNRATETNLHPDSKGDAKLWHLRLGHPSPMSLHQLGVKLNGPKITECQHCRQISRRSPDGERDKPCLELHIGWTDLEEAHADFLRVMFIHNAFSGRSFPTS